MLAVHFYNDQSSFRLSGRLYLLVHMPSGPVTCGFVPVGTEGVHSGDVWSEWISLAFEQHSTGRVVMLRADLS